MTTAAELKYEVADFKYEVGKRLDKFCMKLARHMPGRLRAWVVVDATNTARRMYPHPTRYAGPDGLEYKHIYDGALRVKKDHR